MSPRLKKEKADYTKGNEDRPAMNDDQIFRVMCLMVSGDDSKMPADRDMQREIKHRYEGAKWMRDRMD
jgi:hypothetical protein